jgi:hypothetical protein
MTQTRLGALLSLSKTVGFGLAIRPKTLPKGVIVLGLAGQPDPHHFKKVLSLAAQLDPSILGLAA